MTWRDNVAPAWTAEEIREVEDALDAMALEPAVIIIPPRPWNPEHIPQWEAMVRALGGDPAKLYPGGGRK